MKKQKLLMLLAVTMVLILTAATVSAGEISFAPITGDEDCGISTDNIYTHAIDFGAAGSSPAINGVVFAEVDATNVGNFPIVAGASQTVGTGSTTCPSDNPGWANSSCTGNIKTIISDMVSNNLSAIVTLTGLTPGQLYKVRFYHRQWGTGPGTRTMKMGFVTDGTGTDISAAADTVDFSEDDATQPDPGFATFDQVYALEYTYKLAPGVTSLRVHIDASIGNYHLYMLTNEVLDGLFPEPKDDPDGLESVIAANSLTLSWTNIDPDAVLDVYFGTDPCNLGDPTIVAGNGDERSSLDVDASDVGKYYWRVDMNIGTIADPCVYEGNLYTFTTSGDPGPVIDDITPAQIAWSGGEVPLFVDVTNDGVATTIYEWVTDAAEGVEIKGGDTATPTVTITKMPSFTAKIPNAGFEDPVVPDDTYGDTIPTGWTITEGAGIADAAPGGIIDTVSEGEQCVWANPNGTISTVLSETVQAGVTYTLNVDIGHGQWSNGAKYIVQLIAVDGENEVVLAEDDNSLTIASQTWVTSEISYTNDPVADANKIDLPLMIKLVNPADSAANADVEFDNVVLTSDTLFPVKSGVETVTMTVFVSDGANPIPVDASVEIDVYDDACHVARVVEGLDDLSDLDKDCDIDIDDLALMAATWLNTDKELDGPAASQGTSNVFSVNFWKEGSLYGEDLLKVTVEADQAAGMDDWVATGWENVKMGHGMAAGLPPMEITSNVGSTATFHLISARNGDPYDGSRETLLGDGTADMMDGHVNATEDPYDTTLIYNTEISDIPFAFYEVIVYMGGKAHGGDLTGKYVINGGTEQTFLLMPDRFDGTFVEIVDDTVPGNYLTFTGKGSSFTFKAWGNGFNHLGPNGFQFREVKDPNAPVVSTDGDRITWTGEPATLTATVTEGPETIWDMDDLTYNWTAVPDGLNTNLDGTDDHLDVEISNPTSATPTVTITRVAGPDSILLDGSFEYNVLAEGGWDTTPAPYWIDGQYVLTDPANPVWQVVSSGAGVRNPNTNDWASGISVDGENYFMANSYVGEDSGLFQILSSTLEASTTYAITLMVGNYDNNVREDNPTGAAGDYRVELVAGGVVIASVSGPSPASGTWAPAALSFTSDAAPAQLGEQLEIRILAEAYGGDTGEIDGIDVCFDAVTFTIDGVSTHMTPPPVSDNALSVGLTFSVEEVSTGKTTKAYVMIDVYDDACAAGIASNPEFEFDLGDLTEDCNTNLEDVALLAAAWLVDYSSTGPLDQPEE